MRNILLILLLSCVTGLAGVTGGGGVSSGGGSLTNGAPLHNTAGGLFAYSLTTITTNNSPNTNIYYFTGTVHAGYSTPFYWNGVINGYTNATKAFGSVPDPNPQYYFESGAAPLSSVGGANDEYATHTILPSPQSTTPNNWISLNGETWDSQTGGGDHPLGYFGTNTTYVTNTTTVVTNVYLVGRSAYPIGTNIYLSVFGNDTNAIRGAKDYSYQTIDAAINASVAGDTIWIGAGTFTTTNNGITPKNNTILIGSGMFNTAIPGFNSFIGTASELTTKDCSGGFNATFNSVYFNGNADCINATAQYKITCNNCLFTSTYDTWADAQAQSGGWNNAYTNSTAYFYNCNFITASNNPLGSITAPETFAMGPGKVFVYGGQIVNTAGNTGGGNVIATVPLDKGTNGYAEFWNVGFLGFNPKSGGNLIISNDLGMTIHLYDCAMSTNAIYDPLSKVTILGGVSNIMADGSVPFTGTVQLAGGYSINNGYYNGTAQFSILANGPNQSNLASNEMVTTTGNLANTQFKASGVFASNGGIGTTNTITLTFTGTTGLTNTLDHDATARVSAGTNLQLQDNYGNNIGATETLAVPKYIPLRLGYRLIGTAVTAVLY